jgi:hypothetical protein
MPTPTLAQVQADVTQLGNYINGHVAAMNAAATAASTDATAQATLTTATQGVTTAHAQLESDINSLLAEPPTATLAQVQADVTQLGNYINAHVAAVNAATAAALANATAQATLATATQGLATIHAQLDNDINALVAIS